MKPLTPTMADRAHRALTYVLDQLERDVDDRDIIAGLIDHHGASFRFVSGAHVLTCASIRSSNTANSAGYLLGS